MRCKQRTGPHAFDLSSLERVEWFDPFGVDFQNPRESGVDDLALGGTKAHLRTVGEVHDEPSGTRRDALGCQDEAVDTLRDRLVEEEPPDHAIDLYRGHRRVDGVEDAVSRREDNATTTITTASRAFADANGDRVVSSLGQGLDNLDAATLVADPQADLELRVSPERDRPEVDRRRLSAIEAIEDPLVADAPFASTADGDLRYDILVRTVVDDLDEDVRLPQDRPCCVRGLCPHKQHSNNDSEQRRKGEDRDTAVRPLHEPLLPLTALAMKIVVYQRTNLRTRSFYLAVTDIN